MSYGPDGKRTRLHRLWLSIRNRCNNPRTPDFKYYGGRGIKVCKRWDSFTTFVADVGPHPGDGWTLDRKDTNKDYEPGNVRWATRRTQSENRNYCRLNKEKADEIRVKYSTGRFRQVDLAAEYGVSQRTISLVVRNKAWI